MDDKLAFRTVDWLLYETNYGEIYYRTTLEELKESHRICDNILGEFLEALGCKSFEEAYDKFNELKK